MRQLICEKCNSPATFVEESCSGIEKELCKKHAKEYEIKEILPNRIKTLRRQIQDKKKEIACQNSHEGHKFEDISHMTLILGSNVFRCSKCGTTKEESISYDSLNFIIKPESIGASFSSAMDFSIDNKQKFSLGN